MNVTDIGRSSLKSMVLLIQILLHHIKVTITRGVFKVLFAAQYWRFLLDNVACLVKLNLITREYNSVLLNTFRDDLTRFLAPVTFLKLPYLPTPPFGQNMTLGQIFSGV